MTRTFNITQTHGWKEAQVEQVTYPHHVVAQLLADAETDATQREKTQYHIGHADGFAVALRRGIAIGFTVASAFAGAGIAIAWIVT